jgi:cytochrome c-type biogenesis protein CcmH/NrfG
VTFVKHAIDIYKLYIIIQLPLCTILTMKAKLILLILITAITLHAKYVGDKACLSCHKQEHAQWRDSHHDLAMQKADSKSVLGDFNNSSFIYNGIKSTFYKKKGKYKVKTDGNDGKLQDFDIAYTFGVYPLQQYLIPFSNGRFQVLDIAWDSRSKKEGGQRWFHLHPDDNVTSSHALHWTGPNLNWNYMCADCHSTHLKKNYNPKTESYSTTYEAINVSCEACHGEGDKHVSWARDGKKSSIKDKGLQIDLSAFGKQRWKIDEKSGKPVFLGEIDKSEVELCAQCHSFRSQLDDNFKPGGKFSDHYMVSALEKGLYFADGKMDSEVYVYGSFLQSKMYQEGVSCSDCHNPHSLDRHAKGDIVCAKCHKRVDYATPKHHHHSNGSASCVDCHMPSRTYMGVDVRNDHSFRVPRPDLSIDTDIPNACSACHTDKSAEWASEALIKWYGKTPVGEQNFAHEFEAIRAQSYESPQAVYDVLLSGAPNIAKATVASHLGDYPNRQTYATTLQLLKNSDGLIRLNALRALERFPLETRAKATFELLDDPLKMVRVEAAKQLSAMPQGELPPSIKKKLQKGIDEYKQTLLFNADRAESMSALGELYANLGEDKKAIDAYKKAIKLQPEFVNSYINLAYFYQQRGEDKQGFSLLQDALKNAQAQTDRASVLHTLGLYYVRQKEPKKALEALRESATLDPQNARYAYIYAVALAQDSVPKAIEVLKNSLKRHSGDIATLYALASYYEEIGDIKEAKNYRVKAQELQNFTPSTR